MFTADKLVENGKSPRKIATKSIAKSKRKVGLSVKKLRVPTDKFNPLLRFLEKNCGRSWNKVYSELLERADGLGEIHKIHLKQHIKDFVSLNKIRVRYYSSKFHVDERGILRKSKRYKYKIIQKEITELWYNNYFFQYKNGHWYVFGDGGAHTNKVDENLNFISTTVRMLSNKEFVRLKKIHPNMKNRAVA